MEHEEHLENLNIEKPKKASNSLNVREQPEH
jgi:hypothetical protein